LLPTGFCSPTRGFFLDPPSVRPTRARTDCTGFPPSSFWLLASRAPHSAFFSVIPKALKFARFGRVQHLHRRPPFFTPTSNPRAGVILLRLGPAFDTCSGVVYRSYKTASRAGCFFPFLYCALPMAFEGLGFRAGLFVHQQKFFFGGLTIATLNPCLAFRRAAKMVQTPTYSVDLPVGLYVDLTFELQRLSWNFPFPPSFASFLTFWAFYLFPPLPFSGVFLFVPIM